MNDGMYMVDIWWFKNNLIMKKDDYDIYTLT